MSIDWSKAPAHATHWCPGNARIEEGWIYKAGQEFYSCYAEKSCEHIPNFPAWRALRLIPRPIDPAPWNGEGLPPVGTVCEVLWNEGRMEYLRTKVFGVNEHGQPIHRFDEGPKKYEYQADVLVTPMDTKVFRPIRTPEQIAAEEQESAVLEMLKDAGKQDGPNARLQAMTLYKAG